MKKKRLPPQGGNLTHDVRHEAGYEALRAAVLEGVEFHADKVCGLTVIVTGGICAWVQQANGLKTPPAVKAHSHANSHKAGELAILFANLFEASLLGDKHPCAERYVT